MVWVAEGGVRCRRGESGREAVVEMKASSSSPSSSSRVEGSAINGEASLDEGGENEVAAGWTVVVTTHRVCSSHDTVTVWRVGKETMAECRGRDQEKRQRIECCRRAGSGKKPWLMPPLPNEMQKGRKQ